MRRSIYCTNEKSLGVVFNFNKVFIEKVTKRTLISQFVVVISIASTQIYAIEQIMHHFKNRLQPKFFSKTYKKLAILKGKSFNEGV